MATNSPGAGKEILSGSVPKDVYDYIEFRAQRCEQTKGWAVLRLVELWLAAGAPPLSTGDAILEFVGMDRYLKERPSGTPVTLLPTSVDAMRKAGIETLEKAKRAKRKKHGP